jgi:hypothetical protein
MLLTQPGHGHRPRIRGQGEVPVQHRRQHGGANHQHLPRERIRKERLASELCYDINRILTDYDGMLGGAQLMAEPKTIKITSTPKD